MGGCSASIVTYLHKERELDFRHRDIQLMLRIILYVRLWPPRESEIEHAATYLRYVCDVDRTRLPRTPREDIARRSEAFLQGMSKHACEHSRTSGSSTRAGVAYVVRGASGRPTPSPRWNSLVGSPAYTGIRNPPQPPAFPVTYGQPQVSRAAAFLKGCHDRILER